MTRAVVLFVMCLALSTTVFAAETYPLSVGPYVMLKAGVNAGTIPDGTKTGVVFNGIPDLGAKLFVPFVKTQNIGACVDIGYHTYAFSDKPNDGATSVTTFETRFHVLAISTDFVASAFALGFTFGFSPSATRANVSGTVTQDYQSSELNNLTTDIHLGAMLPLVNSASGRLDLLLRASYMLSDVATNPPSGSSTHVASIALGFDYLFSIEK